MIIKQVEVGDMLNFAHIIGDPDTGRHGYCPLVEAVEALQNRLFPDYRKDCWRS